MERSSSAGAGSGGKAGGALGRFKGPPLLRMDSAHSAVGIDEDAAGERGDGGRVSGASGGSGRSRQHGGAFAHLKDGHEEDRREARRARRRARRQARRQAAQLRAEYAARSSRRAEVLMSLIRGGQRPRGVLVGRSKEALEEDLQRLRAEAEARAAAEREEARALAEETRGAAGGAAAGRHGNGSSAAAGHWRRRVRRNMVLSSTEAVDGLL